MSTVPIDTSICIHNALVQVPLLCTCAGLGCILYLYEEGYLSEVVRGGSMDSYACHFFSTGPFLMFLDVLESREHVCYYKKL